ncbi:MAG: cob(I)yrinic acid a,c-diamide adenosyltransferase [Anaerolineaceae bacterium]|nr:cob(I)yrinic acid a,c-diamide adenosyltransferase [Anaerolineaceae bacterium]
MPGKFYTRKGDDGSTGLLGEGRVAKSDLRMEALGSLDETTAALGVARSLCQSAGASETLVQIQRHLYGIMGEAAATDENAATFRTVGRQQVEWLEQQTDALTELVEVPREFIVPGDSPAGAAVDLARTICRRAERRMVELAERGDVHNPALLHYLNRLSSYCFVLELLENKIAGSGQPTLARK